MAAQLTDHQIRLVEESFAAVAPQGEAIVRQFYKRLFADYPGVLPLFFRSTPAEQQKKLLASLALAVNNLRKPEQLGPVLDQLGARHVEYGAEEAHYAAVGSTLLATLAEFAGDLWGPELEEAWTAVLAAVSQRMIEAGNTVTA